jgi:hypothetical protein
MATYSLAGNTPSGQSIDNNRRLYNFGERVAELAPEQSPFFVYLSKVAKKPTNDPVFKFLEQRHQWQRRNFDTVDAISAADPDGGITALAVDVAYDAYGKSVSTSVQPKFFVGDGSQIISVEMTDDNASNAKKMVSLRITAVDLSTDSAEANLTVSVVAVDGSTTASGWPAALSCAANTPGQVVGTAFQEGTGAPGGWRDELSDREGYCQIFKTAIDLFSGTSLATAYRGVSDEYRRVWREKLMEHKMDLEHAMLFGVGKADESGSGPRRYTHGVIPYIKANGGKTADFTAAASTYDTFIDYMEDFFAPEKGNSGDKLCLASRPVIAWMNKLGSDSFWDNTGGSSSYQLDISAVPGSFGHTVTKINTIFGNLHVVQEPLFRGAYSGQMALIDLKNVAYRPLVGNGKNRDTQIMTNVQANDIDGRKDMILTEAGLEISLPETHGLINFTDL